VLPGRLLNGDFVRELIGSSAISEYGRQYKKISLLDHAPQLYDVLFGQRVRCNAHRQLQSGEATGTSEVYPHGVLYGCGGSQLFPIRTRLGATTWSLCCGQQT
jgi:hypothetical protein